MLFVQLWTIWDINAFHMRYGEKAPSDLIVGGILMWGAVTMYSSREILETEAEAGCLLPLPSLDQKLIQLHHQGWSILHHDAESATAIRRIRFRGLSSVVGSEAMLMCEVRVGDTQVEGQLCRCQQNRAVGCSRSVCIGPDAELE